MKGDFTRNTFNPDKHFLRVLMQQGRVQLDSDWNEQASILLHYIQTLATDLIGPYAGPVGNNGFEVNGGKNGDFTIGEGRYYVNGVLCENERDDITYLNQIDYLLSLQNDALNPGDYLVYLDVWERHISYVEDDDIREKALNGADTATRSKVIWQVKTYKLDSGTRDGQINCQNASNLLKDNLLVLSQACMSARAKKGQAATQPCLTEPEAQYRGAENQLYRVEIHDGNRDEKGQLIEGAAPTFKFSRENGSVIFPIKKVIPGTDSDTTLIELEHLGCDDKLGLSVNDWVEFIDDGIDLHNQTKPLAKVSVIDAMNRTVTLSGAIVVESDYLDRHPFLRRWDQKKANKINSNGVINLMPGDWIPLEDGIEVKFSFTENDILRHGDYWLVPARYVTGDVEWPKLTDENGKVLFDTDNKPIPKMQRPLGTAHDYAPLAIINVAGNKDVTLTSDCRCSFEWQTSCKNNPSRLGLGTDLTCPDNKKNQ